MLNDKRLFEPIRSRDLDSKVLLVRLWDGTILEAIATSMAYLYSVCEDAREHASTLYLQKRNFMREVVDLQRWKIIGRRAGVL